MLKHNIRIRKTANWIVWGGWTGNHDQRIEDSKCSECGYEHRTVFKSLKNLDKYCGGCGASMNVKVVDHF